MSGDKRSFARAKSGEPEKSAKKGRALSSAQVQQGGVRGGTKSSASDTADLGAETAPIKAICLNFAQTCYAVFAWRPILGRSRLLMQQIAPGLATIRSLSRASMRPDPKGFPQTRSGGLSVPSSSSRRCQPGRQQATTRGFRVSHAGQACSGGLSRGFGGQVAYAVSVFSRLRWAMISSVTKSRKAAMRLECRSSSGKARKTGTSFDSTSGSTRSICGKSSIT